MKLTEMARKLTEAEAAEEAAEVDISPLRVPPSLSPLTLAP